MVDYPSKVTARMPTTVGRKQPETSPERNILELLMNGYACGQARRPNPNRSEDPQQSSERQLREGGDHDTPFRGRPGASRGHV